MRFGITILPEHRWADAEPLWRRSEELGFDHAWTYDHLTWGGLPDSPWYGTVSTLTAAAMVTERIRLGTFVTSPNYRHPVTFLRDLLSLEDISGGRILCGIGTGGDLDSRILGGEPLTPRQRVDRLDEFTGLLDRLLTGDHVTSRRHVLLGRRRPHAARSGAAAADAVHHGRQRSPLAAAGRAVRRRLGHHRVRRSTRSRSGGRR